MRESAIPRPEATPGFEELRARRLLPPCMGPGPVDRVGLTLRPGVDYRAKYRSALGGPGVGRVRTWLRRPRPVPPEARADVGPDRHGDRRHAAHHLRGHESPRHRPPSRQTRCSGGTVCEGCAATRCHRTRRSRSRCRGRPMDGSQTAGPRLAHLGVPDRCGRGEGRCADRMCGGDRSIARRYAVWSAWGCRQVPLRRLD